MAETCRRETERLLMQLPADLNLEDSYITAVLTGVSSLSLIGDFADFPTDARPHRRWWRGELKFDHVKGVSVEFDGPLSRDLDGSFDFGSPDVAANSNSIVIELGSGKLTLSVEHLAVSFLRGERLPSED